MLRKHCHRLQAQPPLCLYGTTTGPASSISCPFQLGRPVLWAGAEPVAAAPPVGAASGALSAVVRALSAGDRRGRGPPPAGVGLLRPEFRLLRPGCRTHPGRRGDPVWPPSTAGAVVGANGWPGLEKCSRFLSRYCEPPSMTPKINNPKGMLVSGPRKPLHNPWQFHYTHSNM